MDESREPSLLDGVQAVVDDALEGLFTIFVGRVERYDAARQAVDAQAEVRRYYIDGTGKIAHERLPVIVSAPVLYLGSGPTRDTFPIETGSIVLLLCVSHSIDRWLQVGREVDAADGRRHTLNDAFALPAGHAFGGPAKPPTTAPQDARVLHVGRGLPLKLVSPAADEIVAINSELAALTAKYNDLVAKFNAHLHVTPSGTSDAPAAPYHGDTASAPIGSPRVRVP